MLVPGANSGTPFLIQCTIAGDDHLSVWVSTDHSGGNAIDFQQSKFRPTNVNRPFRIVVKILSKFIKWPLNTIRLIHVMHVAIDLNFSDFPRKGYLIKHSSPNY